MLKKTHKDLIEEALTEIETLDLDQAEDFLEDEDSVFVDLRDPRELQREGKIPNAFHAPRGMLEFWASPASPYYREYFQEDRRTVVFCAGGGRSVLAVKSLESMGFSDVAHLEAGFSGWQKQGEAIEDVSQTSKWMRKPKSA